MTMKSAQTALGASAIVLLATLLTGCASSTDGFTEEGRNDDTVEQGMIKGVMQSLGAVDPTEKPVEYRPRAPLVAPPGRTLPTPAAENAGLRSDFPRNPEDVADEQRRLAAGKAGPADRIMTPDELAKYSIPGAGRDPNRVSRDTSRPLSPDELRGQGAIQAEAVKRAANPTGRKTLIEPPDEYRKPSPNAPVAAPEEKSSWKPSWWPI